MTSRLTMAIPLTVEQRSWRLLLEQCGIGSAVIAVVTFICYKSHLPIATVGFIDLLATVVVSLTYGIWQAILISLVAVSCLNFFFIPPLWFFTVSDERDWIALVSFQVSALVVSRLSSREQKMARDANYQRIQMKKLYELSRGILLFDLHQLPGPSWCILFGVFLWPKMWLSSTPTLPDWITRVPAHGGATSRQDCLPCRHQ